VYFRNTVIIPARSWPSQLVVAVTAGYVLSVLRRAMCECSRARSWRRCFVPAIGASAFNVVLVKRFFDDLPREIFEAARMDGAGPFRLFWRSSCRCRARSWASCPSSPCRRRGRTSCGRWSCCGPGQASVRLPTLQPVLERDNFLAVLLISTLLPLVVFLIFQRMFLRTGDIGGAGKG
jgi:multiple sugar transport system permease protein